MAEFVLGLESSCDETSAAVVRLEQEKILLLAEVTARQEEVHQKFGGVVPELASRRHLETLMPVVKAALQKANLTYDCLDAIAVTNRPGLVGSLLVGVNAAKTLSYGLGIPLIPVNHLEAHLAAILLDGANVSFPCLGLLVSGGHTCLYKIEEGWKGFSILGQTRDDAAGEAFDKGARLLGYAYPGGPEIAKKAINGNPTALDFPRALSGKNERDFSFSGLKTALSLVLKNQSSFVFEDICASYQEAIVDALINKTLAALERESFHDLVIAGGVAANLRLREKMKKSLPQNVQLHIPSPQFCTDNGAMIAALGSLRWKQGEYLEGENFFSLDIRPRVMEKKKK